MKKLLAILIFFSALSANGQDWRTFNAADFENPAVLNWWGEERGRFEINPYNNWIWMLRSYGNYHITDDGTYEKHFSDVHPNLTSSIYYNSIAFINDTTYILDRQSGLYKYNTDWVMEQPVVFGVSMFVEGNSIWIGATNSTNAYRYTNGILTQMNFEAEHIRSKNGIIWYLNDDEFIYRYYTGSIGTAHSADTSKLLGTPTDFKFKPGTDSLFASTNLGISIANETHFVDSITMNNTINMPYSSIVEFEFDSNDNIWALFGDDYWSLSHLAYLDRQTGEWSMIYDGNNSPLNFTRPLSIEIDSNDNLWVSEYNKIHVLESNAFGWLNVENLDESDFSIYPNPSNGKIRIDLAPGVSVEEIQLADINGRIVHQSLFQNELTFNQQRGVYFLRLMKNDSIVGISKVVLK